MKASLLYVEDEEFDVLFMRRAFAKAGIDLDLHIAADGQQAIDYLAGSTRPLPRLVLLDLNLPVCSGFDVLRWIRGQTALKDLPVVIFSSSDRLEDRSTARNLGADDYIQKPGSAADFTQVALDLHARWLSDCERRILAATPEVSAPRRYGRLPRRPSS